MRYLAIGDIHGCSIALEALLDVVDPYHYDRLITLGDYINKGPDTKGTLEKLIALHDCGKLIPLKGNHEVKMLQAKALQRLSIGGSLLIDSHMLNSYGKDLNVDGLQNIPETHWHFIESTCLDYWEGDSAFCVHATVDPHKTLAEQPQEKLFWEKFNFSDPHVSGKTMICGHTPQTNGVPLSTDHAICIDTLAHSGLWLTGLDLQTGQYWQANQQGEIRTSHISSKSYSFLN